jgi:cytochrome c oxidase cbb3-type subunit I/II
VGQNITSVEWHVRHLYEPQSKSPNSIMPAYPWLLEDELDFDAIAPRVRAMKKLGVPYTDEQVDNAASLARAQAREIFDRLVQEDETYKGSGLETKQVTALVAYLLRLGTDITKDPPPDSPGEIREDVADDAAVARVDEDRANDDS